MAINGIQKQDNTTSGRLSSILKPVVDRFKDLDKDK